MCWIYNGTEFTDDDIQENIGFVYIIINNLNAKRYIGKKLFKFSRTKQVKGKKKKIKIDSDWKQYYGSNKELLEDVEKYGPGNFTRSIIKVCNTKGSANYWESYFILTTHALLSETYYNSWLSVKVSKSHLKEKFPNEQLRNHNQTRPLK